MKDLRQLQAPPKGAYCDLDDLISLRFLAKELTLNLNKSSQAMQSGPARTRFRGRGMEFEEVRHYQAGDDIRTISSIVSDPQQSKP